LTTKEKIVLQATQLFNKEGFGSVSLLEIAQKLAMSRGNLTYHFRDKDAILEAISSEMWEKIEIEKRKSRQLPSFENLHNEVQLYYKFQKQYAFIFLDRLVLNHPVVREQFREMTERTISDNNAAIAFAIQLGNMKPEPVKGMYHNLAFVTWMLAFFWLSQQVIRGEKTGEDGERMIWSLMVPHMTGKGIKSFKNFFGGEYYEELGPKFEVDLAQLINF
jgi:AcrR family transcriptional regulator